MLFRHTTFLAGKGRPDLCQAQASSMETVLRHKPVNLLLAAGRFILHTLCAYDVTHVTHQHPAVTLSSAGRKEFTAFLPEATQGVAVQPVGSQGVLILGTDTVRGLSRLDQVGTSQAFQSQLPPQRRLDPARKFLLADLRPFPHCVFAVHLQAFAVTCSSST